MSQVSISEASRNLSHWINQASYGRECVVLTSRGRAKAVLMGIEVFEQLIGLDDQLKHDPIPLDQLRTAFRQALEKAGYRTKEELVALVREVKQELADETFGQAVSNGND